MYCCSPNLCLSTGTEAVLPNLARAATEPLLLFELEFCAAVLMFPNVS